MVGVLYQAINSVALRVKSLDFMADIAHQPVLKPLIKKINTVYKYYIACMLLYVLYYFRVMS